MKIFNHTHFSILFGNAKTNAFNPEDIYSLIDNYPDKAIEKIKNKLLELNHDNSIKNLFFLRQTHSIHGLILKDKLNINSFCHNGDYLITSTKNLAIGILTADCLPIIFYDAINNIIAIAHAGWPGSVSGIAPKVIHEMQINFNTNINDIQIFFGPSAKVCCYEVKQDFIDKLDIEVKKQTIVKQDSKTFFNLPLYNILTLEKIGINKKKIDLNYNFCTICNIEYCSYRRDKEFAGRQMTIITLY